MASKRELIEIGTDNCYRRRDTAGWFKVSDRAGRSLPADQRHRAGTVSRPSQGEKYDRIGNTS